MFHDVAQDQIAARSSQKMLAAEKAAPDMGMALGYRESVLRMRTAPPFTRFIWAALLALLLGLRLLGATGYMPGFEHGTATIIVCPDADADAPLAIDLAHHHHDHSKHKHGGTCPYASASSLGALLPELGALLAILIFAAALLLGRTSNFVDGKRFRERPPTRGPPLLA